MAIKSNKSSSHTGRNLFLFFFVLLIAIIAGLIMFSNYIASRADDNFLETYVPSPEILEIVEKTTMTDKAIKIFYLADPEFITVDVFKEYCLADGGVELALACARSTTPGEPRSSPRVFLLQMDNPKFADSMFPSSGHELMHLVYQEFDDSEVQRLAPLIDSELDKRKEDAHLQRIADIMKKSLGDEYQAELRGELHSIFAVEYADLSPELEEYYAEYFTDRQQLVSLHVNSYLTQQIIKLGDLTWKQSQLNARLQKMSSQLKSYQQSGVADQHQGEFNEYNSLVNQYNALSRTGSAAQAEVGEMYKLINPDFSP